MFRWVNETILLAAVQFLRRVWLFGTSWTAAGQTFLSFTVSLSLLKFMSTELMMISNHLILCHSSSCSQFFPASWSFPMGHLFTSGGQSIGASAWASVLSMNIQGWFQLALTNLISLLSKARVFSNTTIRKHKFFGVQTSLWSNSATKTIVLTIWTFVNKVMFLFFNMLSIHWMCVSS